MDHHDDRCESFNRIVWHDSKLRALRIERGGDVDDVVLDLELRGISDLELTPATVALEDAAFFICDLDLHGKRECSDDISSARCDAESELKRKILKERLRYSPDALSGYLHFSFYLVPPGGTLDVIAMDFKLLIPDTTGTAQREQGGTKSRA
jgi:hypothetical protein